MKTLALATCFNYDASPEFWAEAAKAGFTDAEIDTHGAQTETDDIIAEAAAAYEALKAGGLKPSSLHLPFSHYWDVSQNDDAIREEVLCKQETIIRWMGEHGITYAVLHPSAEPIDDSDRPSRIAHSAESIARLGKTAAACGVIVAVEDLPRTCLGNCADELLKIIGDQDSVRICFDVNHLLKESHKDFVAKAGKYIVTTHLSDYDFADECHWMPGEGDIDWKELHELLNGVGYEGRWLFELTASKCAPSLGRSVTAKELADRFFEVIG